MRAAEQKNELIDLKLQLKQLMDNPQLMMPKDQSGFGNENSSLTSNVKSDLYVTKKESEQQIKELQEKLQGKLKDLLRDSRESVSSMQMSMLTPDERALLKRPASRGIIAGINSGTPAVASGLGPGAGGGSSGSTSGSSSIPGLSIDDMGKIHRDVMEYVEKLQKNANEAILFQLRVCEEALIEQKSKNLVLTEQLSDYQKLMKKTTMQFKRQLLVLQEKLIKAVEQQQQQQQHGEAGGGRDLRLDDAGDGDDLKLPSIAK